jgi:hypothetical protein
MDLKRNTLRRKLTPYQERESQFDQNIDLTKVKFNKILICRPNPRLGNQLLITPYYKRSLPLLPNAK